MMRFPRMPLILSGLILCLQPAFAATSAHSAQSPRLVAYNGSFVSSHDDEPDKDSQDFKIKRDKSKGAQLIEHTLSLLLDELKDAKRDKDKQAVMKKANKQQKLVLVVYEFRKAMEKGGFQAYFRADAGNQMGKLKQALIALHANQYLLVLNKAVKAFADDPHVLDDTFGRNQVLDQMDEFERFSFFEEVDSQYRSLEEDELLVERLSKYLNDNAKHFYAKAE